MNRYAFGAKKKATKKASKKRGPKKKATRKLTFSQKTDRLQKRLCRVSHAPGPRCKSEVRYGMEVLIFFVRTRGEAST